jgi:hypothetical protein
MKSEYTTEQQAACSMHPPGSVQQRAGSGTRQESGGVTGITENHKQNTRVWRPLNKAHRSDINVSPMAATHGRWQRVMLSVTKFIHLTTK